MIWLRLKLLYWRWQRMEARTFQANLERVIVSERRRAKDAVEHAETMEARMEIQCVLRRAR